MANKATITPDVLAQGILEALYHVFSPCGACPQYVKISFDRHVANTLAASLVLHSIYDNRPAQANYVLYIHENSSKLDLFFKKVQTNR